MFQNIFSFKGRIRRTEYGISCLIYIIIIPFLNRAALTSHEIGIFYIPLIWLILSQGAKRCHDIGNSGFFQLIPFYVFWMLFQDSNNGQNVFGLNPKRIDNPQVETNKTDV